MHMSNMYKEYSMVAHLAAYDLGLAGDCNSEDEVCLGG